jgi:hypothetical protein
MPQLKPLPPFERIRELLAYDSETGKLYWKQSVARWIKPGDEAGTHVKRAIDVTIDRKTYRAHRVIWMLQTGEDPGASIIDHIDGNFYNNRFENLRLATPHQNLCNQKKRRDNTSGLKGVSWSEERQKWQTGIQVNGKRISLGRFDTKEEAYAAYCEAARRLHGEFARLD